MCHRRYRCGIIELHWSIYWLASLRQRSPDHRVIIAEARNSRVNIILGLINVRAWMWSFIYVGQGQSAPLRRWTHPRTWMNVPKESRIRLVPDINSNLQSCAIAIVLFTFMFASCTISNKIKTLKARDIAVAVRRARRRPLKPRDAHVIVCYIRAINKSWKRCFRTALDLILNYLLQSVCAIGLDRLLVVLYRSTFYTDFILLRVCEILLVCINSLNNINK